MEVREANDVTGARVRFILITGDNPLRLHNNHHRTEEPILDELQRNLLGEARMTPWIH
jgi:hypothetical protein